MTVDNILSRYDLYVMLRYEVNDLLPERLVLTIILTQLLRCLVIVQEIPRPPALDLPISTMGGDVQRKHICLG